MNIGADVRENLNLAPFTLLAGKARLSRGVRGRSHILRSDLGNHFVIFRI